MPGMKNILFFLLYIIKPKLSLQELFREWKIFFLAKVIAFSNLNNINIYIYFKGFTPNSNSSTANYRNWRIQISSLWRVRKCNPYFIRPRLCCNVQLLIWPSCKSFCTFAPLAERLRHSSRWIIGTHSQTRTNSSKINLKSYLPL